MPLPTDAEKAADDELVRRLTDGDDGALAALYDRYVTRVHRVALAVSHDPLTVEEVVQETFLALWDRAEQFDPARGTLGTWLATIARHRAVDRWRAASRRLDAPALSTLTAHRADPDEVAEWLAATGTPLASAAPAPLPDIAAIASETSAELAGLVAGLTDPEREVILLAYRDGLSQSEIAAHLGWPIGTVKTRSRRALRRLRESLVAQPAIGSPVLTVTRSALAAAG